MSAVRIFIKQGINQHAQGQYEQFAYYGKNNWVVFVGRLASGRPLFLANDGGRTLRLRVYAGCHEFSLEQAKYHWHPNRHHSHNRERCQSILFMIASGVEQAKQRGWLSDHIKFDPVIKIRAARKAATTKRKPTPTRKRPVKRARRR